MVLPHFYALSRYGRASRIIFGLIDARLPKDKRAWQDYTNMNKESVLSS